MTGDFIRKFGSYNEAAISPKYFSGLTQDFGSAIVIKVTGQNGTAVLDDLVCEGMMVEYLG